jgi:tetratricopeptide (TPR) repeat protein
MAYSNELWGGPSATYKYLTDSNTDWGQQLIATKKYLDQHGVKNCWFAYFVYPAIRPSSYGIPCQPLPTPDTNWFGEQVDAPATVEGPVLISASVLTGYERGSNILNPYRQFQAMRPSAVIEHGIFVFDGTFSVPMAAALGHVQRARLFYGKKQFDEALKEARTAEDLDAAALQTQMVMGDVLMAMGRGAEADASYEKALAVAHAMEPSAQKVWISNIDQKRAIR